MLGLSELFFCQPEVIISAIRLCSKDVIQMQYIYRCICFTSDCLLFEHKLCIHSCGTSVISKTVLIWFGCVHILPRVLPCGHSRYKGLLRTLSSVTETLFHCTSY